MTLAAALLVFTNSPLRLVPVSSPAATHETVPPADRVTYVSPVPPPVRRIRAVVPPRVPVTPRPNRAAPDHAPVAQPRPKAAVSDSSAAAPATGARRSSLSEFERKWTAHGVSPLLLPGSPPNGAFGGAASSPGAAVRMPQSHGADDAQLRAQADADMAAHAAGTPMPTTPGGIAIPAPIPFGGPSRAERKRDSTINAQTKAVLQRVWQRLDSIAAARRQRHADSLAALEKHP